MLEKVKGTKTDSDAMLAVKEFSRCHTRGESD